MEKNRIISASFDLGMLSRYRLQLMGIATIAIIVCHAPGNGVLMSELLKKICGFGYIGVDMFLFLSGLGLYYSLSKDSREGRGILMWYWKRLKRIFVPYWLMVIPWLAYKVLTGAFGVPQVIGNLFAYDYWMTGGGAWFVSLIIPLYFITPLLFGLIRTSPTPWVIIFTLLLCLGFSFLRELTYDFDSVKNLSNVFDRVPAFVLGLSVGKFAREGKRMPYLFFGLVIVFFFLYRHFFPRCLVLWIYALPFMVVLSLIMNRWKWFNALFDYMGQISLESYLANIFLGNVLMGLSWQVAGHDLSYGHYLEYFVVVVFGVAWAALSHGLSNRIINRPHTV